jgi:hypothetical protein
VSWLMIRCTAKVSDVFGLHVNADKLIRLGNLLKPVLKAALTAGCQEVWPIAWPKASKTAQMGLIQTSV